MNEDYPRLLKTRLVKKDGARYFGPYSDVAAVNRALELLNKLFKLKRCSATSFPEGFKPCLNYHIGLCVAPCAHLVTKKEYRMRIDRIVRFLNGDSKEIVTDLQRKMSETAGQENYEDTFRGI